MRVLYVEDDLTLATSVAKVLKGFGHSVDVVATLAAGLTALLREQYDEVLLDLELPDAHGVEAIRAIRNLFPHVPIVAATGSADQTVLEEAVRLGVAEIVRKGSTEASDLAMRCRLAIARQKPASMEIGDVRDAISSAIAAVRKRVG